VPAVRFAVRLFKTGRTRLRLHIEERHTLHRLEEGRDVVVAEGRGVDELERRSGYRCVALAIAATVLPPRRI
jgi:hypothetical protein